MKTYRVARETLVREYYLVDAENEEEARDNFWDGPPVNSEAWDTGFIEVTEEKER